jgi:hypothetical protein
MKYRKRTDGSLVTKSQLKSENTNTSLPKTWTADTLEFLGVDPVLAGLKPAHDVDPELDPRPLLGDYEVAVADGAVKDGDNWVEAWKVQPMFAEYVDEDGKAVSVEQQIADYDASKLQKRREGMTVSNVDLRLAMNEEGLYGAVEGAMAKSTNTTELEIQWTFSSTINRLDPWVAEITSALGMMEDQVDNLFSKAAGEV